MEKPGKSQKANSLSTPPRCEVVHWIHSQAGTFLDLALQLLPQFRPLSP